MQTEKELKQGRIYTASPLPFQGQKRFFVNEFKTALQEFCQGGKITTVIDLFGGSGLLSHTAKRLYPDLTVVFNDYDDFHLRLDAIPETNAILEKIRTIMAGYPKGQKIDPEHRARILDLIREADRRGFVDYISLSGSLLFSANYVQSFEEFDKATLYNRVRQAGFHGDGYLDGVEVVKCDYADLFSRYKGRPDVLFVVDPPYLSTDTASYHSDKYWKLRDYLDVLKVLPGQNYVFFTSDKSSLVELCQWMAENPLEGNPFSRATIKAHQAAPTGHGRYTDMMLYREAFKESA